MLSLKLRYAHLFHLCHKRNAGVWCAELLSVCMNAGEQRISQRAALSLREGDNGVANRATGNAGSGSGKLAAEKGRGLGQSGGWKTQPAGARRLDGFHSRAAQRKRPIEFCARSQINTQQVGRLADITDVCCQNVKSQDYYFSFSQIGPVYWIYAAFLSLCWSLVPSLPAWCFQRAQTPHRPELHSG